MTLSAFAPASASNIACGFDILGFALDHGEGDGSEGGQLGDTVIASVSDRAGVELVGVEGDGGRLPRAAGRNTASVAARSLLERAGRRDGVALTLHKGLPLGSGLGSSAASAVAAVVAVDALLELGADRQLLLECALDGEAVGCGSRHADNAAPSLYGGFVLVRSTMPLDVVELPVPAGLDCVIVRPHVVVETRAARSALSDQLPLATAVRQWGNVGALVAALYRGDLELLGRSLEDHVAEPVRAPMVPGFASVRDAAMSHGAIGCSLSGSGPSIFALTPSREVSKSVGGAMAAVYDHLGIVADLHLSAVGAEGARVLGTNVLGTNVLGTNVLGTSVRVR